MTARERIEYLLDEESFQELDMLNRHYASGMGLEESRPYTDGVITGYGKIDGRKVCVYSQDFTVFGGALGETHGEKIHKIMDLATTMGFRSSGSMTVPAREFKKASPGSTRTAASSSETRKLRAWCRRSR
jgi:acetyl-CoA carboxylase carboxyltransferase component